MPALDGPGEGGASPLACPSSAVAPPAVRRNKEHEQANSTAAVHGSSMAAPCPTDCATAPCPPNRRRSCTHQTAPAWPSSGRHPVRQLWSACGRTCGSRQGTPVSACSPAPDVQQRCERAGLTGCAASQAPDHAAGQAIAPAGALAHLGPGLAPTIGNARTCGRAGQQARQDRRSAEQGHKRRRRKAAAAAAWQRQPAKGLAAFRPWDHILAAAGGAAAAGRQVWWARSVPISGPLASRRTLGAGATCMSSACTEATAWGVPSLLAGLPSILGCWPAAAGCCHTWRSL